MASSLLSALEQVKEEELELSAHCGRLPRKEVKACWLRDVMTKPLDDADNELTALNLLKQHHQRHLQLNKLWWIKNGMALLPNSIALSMKALLKVRASEMQYHKRNIAMLSKRMEDIEE
jgi:hypothetical protein